jgi:hypothetical protein
MVSYRPQKQRIEYKHITADIDYDAGTLSLNESAVIIPLTALSELSSILEALGHQAAKQPEPGISGRRLH